MKKLTHGDSSFYKAPSVRLPWDVFTWLIVRYIMKYLISCSKGHKVKVTAENLEEWLEEECCQTTGCDGEIVDVEPNEISVECVDCGWAETSPWDEAIRWLWVDCPRCASNTGTSGNVRIVGSKSHAIGEYESFCDSIDTRPFKREGRPDYWEIIVHYTKRTTFLKIFNEKKIEAAPTGFFRLPAVCLTEAPITFSAEFRSRYGPYGVAFRKSDLLKAGGGPAIYLPDVLIRAQNSENGFHESLKPFLNVVRIPATAPAGVCAKKVDFLFDREWRFPTDIDFNKLRPLGVVLPEGATIKKFDGPEWRDLIHIAWNFRELR